MTRMLSGIYQAKPGESFICLCMAVLHNWIFLITSLAFVSITEKNFPLPCVVISD